MCVEMGGSEEIFPPNICMWLMTKRVAEEVGQERIQVSLLCYLRNLIPPAHSF